MRSAIAAAILVALPVFAAPPAKKPATAPKKRAVAATSAERRVTYKEIDGVSLDLVIENPPGHRATEKRPAIVFFFGGGWSTGTPAQFAKHAQYLAAQGMVAICADYRTASRHKARVIACVADARSAIRYVREHAAELGIDPKRIAAAGGSAGGHLAAATAFIDEFDTRADNAAIAAEPDALVLFNPALMLSNLDGVDARVSGTVLTPERLGASPDRLSPAHHVRAGGPPTIIFHGTADTTVPFATVKVFTAEMERARNDCRLVPYKNQTHGFFNVGRSGNKWFFDTLAKTHEFLASLGWLEGPSKVTEFFKARAQPAAKPTGPDGEPAPDAPPIERKEAVSRLVPGEKPGPAQ